jgi:tetratricopeptide (TPR) repeat protein
VWEQAQTDLQLGRFEQVGKAVSRLSRMREPTPLDWLLRGQLAVALEEPDLALAHLARVPDSHYMAAQARLLAGQIELRRDRLRFAEEAFRAALRLDPKLVQAHRELIYIYGMQLRRAELNAEFHSLASLSNLRFEEAFHWCLLRNESWEASEAAPLLANNVAADPGDRWSRLALSENYRRMGMVDDADRALEGLAADDPETIAAHARIAFDRNDEERAERLLSSGPADDPLLARLRGRLALSRRDAPAALHHFRIAYAADPESRETLAGLISALVTVGDFKSAASLREIAGKLAHLGSLVQRAGTKGARELPDLPRQLGSACAALHRDAEARTWYKLAIERDPLDSQSQQALFQLNTIVHDARTPPPAAP